MMDDYNERRAADDARMRGIGFLVDGKYVEAERVQVITASDADNPISQMRAATADARKAMADYRELFADSVILNPEQTRRMSNAIRHLCRVLHISYPNSHLVAPKQVVEDAATLIEAATNIAASSERARCDERVRGKRYDKLIVDELSEPPHSDTSGS